MEAARLHHELAQDERSPSRRRHRLQRSLLLVEKAIALTDARRLPRTLSHHLAVRMRLLEQLGRSDEARASFEQLRDVAASHQFADPLASPPPRPTGRSAPSSPASNPEPSASYRFRASSTTSSRSR